MRTRFARRRVAALTGAAIAGTALLAIVGVGANAAGLVLNNGTDTPFHLAKVGPINALDGLPATDALHDPTANGFPYWYSDGADELELCLDPPTPAGDNCALTGEIPNPDEPITFPQSGTDPGNFPGEAFYWMGTGGGDIGTGANAGRSLIVMSLEAAFANEDPAIGDQMVFSRTRMRIDIPDVAGDYKVVWPYGEKVFDAQPGRRSINITQDVGIQPGEFTASLKGNIGPFLRWDATPPAAPEGFLGDAGTLHGVTGSPYVYQGRNANFFRIEGPAGAVLRAPGDANGCPDRPLDTNCIEYPQFTILGKLAARSGVEGTRATYTRTGASTTIDLFGYSLPGSRLQAGGDGIPSANLDADAASGFYFARLSRATAGFDPAQTVILRNLSDKPNTKSIVHLTDGVTVSEATYYNSAQNGHVRGDLVVTASTSDDQNSAPLTVADFGPLPAAGANDAPRTATFGDGPGDGLSSPPAEITVTSAMGGSDTVPVKVVGAASPLAITTAVIGVSGQTGTAGNAQMFNTLKLAGADSEGDYKAWRWVIETPTSAAPGFNAGAHTPALVAGSLTGVVNPGTGQLGDLAVKPISVLLPGEGLEANNFAHDVSFTLKLYADEAAMNADTGAVDATTVTVHVEAATAPVARLAAAAAVAQRTVATLDASASLAAGTFVWQQLDPAGNLPAPPAPGGEAAYQAALAALPVIDGDAKTRVPALGGAAKVSFTMPAATSFQADQPGAPRSAWHVRIRVRALSALGAGSDSYAVVDVPFKSDVLTGLDAKYDANKNQLRVRGAAAVFGVANNVKVFAGDRAADFDADGDYVGGSPAPAFIGQGGVAADGTFDLRLTPANPQLPNGFVTVVTTAGAVAQIAPDKALVLVPVAATRLTAAVASRAKRAGNRVRVRLVIKAKGAAGKRCALRTTKTVLQRKACGRTQTAFIVTAKRGTVVFVQISGKKVKTVNTRRIRL